MLEYLVNPILYSVLRRKALRAVREFRSVAERCAEQQGRVLREKMRRAAGTRYGRLHGFSSISTPEEYRKNVPVVEYPDIEPFVRRIIEGELNVLFPPSDELIMFAITSGTTASPKYIPVTAAFFRELRRGNFIWGAHLVSDHPDVIDQRILHIVSPSTELRTARGVPCGAATGLVAESQEALARIKYALPQVVFSIADYSAKYYTIMRLSLQKKISLLIAANPSTLVALGQCLERGAARLIRDVRDGTLTPEVPLDKPLRRALRRRIRADRKLASRLEGIVKRHGRLLPRLVWPELRVIACWTGGTLTPYLGIARNYWGEKPLRDPGLIASEGRMTIPLEDGPAGGVLDVESHFYEFIPYGEKVGGSESLLAHELDAGREYYVILTTSSGFFRYNISDVVRVEGWYGEAPIVRFLHKGSRICSLTGEKVSEHQVVQAFQACEQELNFSVPQFTVCPGWAVPPFYFLLIEDRDDGLFSGAGGRGLHEAAVQRFDEKLKELNIEYRNKRNSGRLGKPRLQLIERGSFESKKAEQIEKSGGRLEQYKHPYLSPRLDYCKTFRPVESRRSGRRK